MEPGPFQHAITVRWGNCDPARIAYTGWIPWWALEAIDAWWAAKIGHGWYQMELDEGFGTPFVGLSMDFRSPITPRHPLICEVEPQRLGRTSITFEVKGYQDGTLCFEGKFTSVFMQAGKFEPALPPEDVRACIEAHLSQQRAQ